MFDEAWRPSFKRRVVHIPNIDELSGNPYWSRLRASLQTHGVESEAAAGALSAKWLWRNRGRIQVIHLHYVQQFYAYEATQARLRWVLRLARNILLARVLGYRVVFTLHNLTPTYSLRPGWVDRLGHMCAVTLSRTVIVHCEAARRSLRNEYGRSSGVAVVPHPNYVGVYENVVSRQAARRQLGLDVDNLVIAFIGGIRPNKGVDKLIRAFRAVAGERTRLVIAGKPWPPEAYMHTVEELARGDDRVRLVPGFVADDDLQVYLKAADIVAIPFESILTSGSAMLALSFGRPVIAPAMGCLPELLGQGAGLLYEPGAADGLSRALDAAESADLPRMQRNALAVASRFSLEQFGHLTASAYGWPVADACTPGPAA